MSSSKSNRFLMSSIRKGQCKIVDISRCEAQKSKLRSVGLIENAVVDVIRGSEEGMMMLLVGKSRMGLSHFLASKILVEPADETVCFVIGGEENNAPKGHVGRRRCNRCRTGW